MCACPEPNQNTDDPDPRNYRRCSEFKKRGYIYVTATLFFVSLLGHWGLAYAAYAKEHPGKEFPVSEAALEIGRDTLENWQSEFLQLIWQIAGLAWLLCVGSPASKEEGERLEEKIDFLMNQTPEGRAKRKELDDRFVREQ